MIRLPPTVISISIGEVQDYEKRRQKRALKESLRGTVLETLKRTKSNAERVEAASNETAIDHSFETAPHSSIQSQACSPTLLVERIDNLRLESDTPSSQIKSPEQLFPAWYGMDGLGYDPGEPSSNISPVFEEPPGLLGRRVRQTEILVPDVAPSRRWVPPASAASSSQSRAGDIAATPRAVPSNTRDLSRRPGTPFRSSARSVSPESERSTSFGSVVQQRAFSPGSQRSLSVGDSAPDRTPSRVPSASQNHPGKSGGGTARHGRYRSFSANCTSKLRGDAIPDEDPSSSSAFSIYNDGLPPQEQPQTPFHLPESRHRSRIVTPFTAPAARGRSRTVDDTPTSTRYRSPQGMIEPGFLGLYGGTENQDDLLLFQEGERRLGTGTPGFPLLFWDSVRHRYVSFGEELEQPVGPALLGCKDPQEMPRAQPGGQKALGRLHRLRANVKGRWIGHLGE
ncbi:hypothetical protein MKZ38_007651 [Zalerion maritima]|uniref:Uncharacterized protein n=1 Tax=Zalerion maritima TaxID=339359 RepID=A0AAD5S0R1_9PEZI|nr:hypothetical protein MKZ38_007651 [Zalerion maritima]